MTATYSEESREAGKGDSELLSFRRGLVTRVPPICCPFPLPLLGHGAINTFQFNFPRPLSEDRSHCTSTVPKSELCWCHCSVKSKCRDAGCSLHEVWGHQLTWAGHWLPGSHLPGQALLSLPGKVSRYPVLYLQHCCISFVCHLQETTK